MIYKTIYADPPWNITGGKNGKSGWSKSASADVHYPVMSVEDISVLPISRIVGDDAHLWLWVPNCFLPQGLAVMNSWGFRYVSNMCWHKEGSIGLGQYMRTMHEICLFGVRGKIPYSRDASGKRDQPRSIFTSPRGRHSAKPNLARLMIERVSPGPRIELFAREHAPGWDCWGNEVDSTIVMPPAYILDERIKRECDTCVKLTDTLLGSD